MEFAMQKKGIVGDGKMLCPCAQCENKFHLDVKTIEYHIVVEGFVNRYTVWYFHGEPREQFEAVEPSQNRNEVEMREMLQDAFFQEMRGDNVQISSDSYFTKFEEIMEDARRPLYNSCENYSKLSFMVHMFQLKCLHKWSNKSFLDVFALFKNVLPKGNTIPPNWYESKKMMSDLGLDYKKIHACPNDCILLINEFETLNYCPKCGASRWRNDKKKKKNVPVKILRHFPLISRLQRLFMSTKTSSSMTWHFDIPYSDDGKLSHPWDSVAWKYFDTQYPIFSRDPHNIRLGLDIKLPDGFSSNIPRQVQVKERKIVGLKSHDCHVLMQQLFALAMRGSLSTQVATVLNEYCTFFRELYGKLVDVKILELLEMEIPVILSKLERIFSSAFFDVIVHLTIDLVTEGKLEGPVQYRWMYPIE
ncbi:hypothetical protein H6P81_013388 [Aristolochia fimbriata]|uniref:Transposase-associated domain-containing protein n=1 Tax=Aristolochia fimbriata TaxID=158543 RepID=A0AAV7EEL0_ARIFI|nr:hypothetical protein H6P81_013388 [Aristolochia fimbriata]